jgi:type IV pilus assembly protein PilB
VSSETTGREIELRQSVPYPEIPDSKRISVEKITDVLVYQGKVSEEQVRLALEAQKNNPRQDLGKILLSLGFISGADLAQAQAQRLGLDYVELYEKDFDRDVVALVPERVLRKHGAIPLRISRTRHLVVAMSDPSNLYALEDLRIISGYQITPVVAAEDEIRNMQAKLFATGERITKILEEAAEAGLGDDEELDLGIEAGPDERPIVRLVSSVLQHAVGDGASDVHIEPQAREVTVRFRVDGVLREVMSIPPKLQNSVTARFKLLAEMNIAEKRLPQDGRFSVKLNDQKIDFRVASLPTAFGEKIVLRLLDTVSVEADLGKLGLEQRDYERFEAVFRRPYGATLVTGPTGSGKSTTLYATLKELNSPEKNIITVEDPVEYKIPGLNQVQINPRVGLTFASGLRNILRADPDIVMIGEIRDKDTAKISVEAALTGHLVLATLHTNDAPGALSRLTDMGVEPYLTSSAVDCVIAQRLVRKLCERCKEPVEIEREILEGMEFPFALASEGLHFHRAVGCRRCGDSGYRGRTGIYELMVISDEIRKMILSRSSSNEISSLAESQGMVRLRDDGLLKAAKGHNDHRRSIENFVEFPRRDLVGGHRRII